MAWIGLLALGFVAGVCLGALFFGGLWWTSDRLAESAHPGRLIAVSFIGRIALIAVGLLLLARIDGLLLIGSLPGLIVAREMMTRAATRHRLPLPTSTQGRRTSDGRA